MPLDKDRFLLCGETFKVKLSCGSKGKVISIGVKGLSMKIESYYNEYVSRNIFEIQDKFETGKSVNHSIIFICPLLTNCVIWPLG